jgi:type II secretory pathway pseudopilin PulG
MRAGFTLLELVVVLFFITLILGLSTVFFSGGLASVRIVSTAREMSATMKHAQSLARINHEKQIITIDLDAKRYGIEGRTTREIPRDTQIKVVDPFSGEIFKGKYRLVFPVMGSAGGGVVVLWNNRKKLSIWTDPVAGSRISESGLKI